MTQVQAAPANIHLCAGVVTAYRDAPQHCSALVFISSLHTKRTKAPNKKYTNNVQLMTDCHSLGNIFQILLTDRNSGLHERLFSGPKVS